MTSELFPLALTTHIVSTCRLMTWMLTKCTCCQRERCWQRTHMYVDNTRVDNVHVSSMYGDNIYVDKMYVDDVHVYATRTITYSHTHITYTRYTQRRRLKPWNVDVHTTVSIQNVRHICTISRCIWDRTHVSVQPGVHTPSCTVTWRNLFRICFAQTASVVLYE